MNIQKYQGEHFGPLVGPFPGDVKPEYPGVYLVLPKDARDEFLRDLLNNIKAERMDLVSALALFSRWDGKKWMALSLSVGEADGNKYMSYHQNKVWFGISMASLKTIEIMAQHGTAWNWVNAKCKEEFHV